MEQPGKLHEMFGGHKSDSDNPELEWSVMGTAINNALDLKERKKKRLFFWLFLGLGSMIGIALLLFISTPLNMEKSHNKSSPLIAEEGIFKGSNPDDIGKTEIEYGQLEYVIDLSSINSKDIDDQSTVEQNIAIQKQSTIAYDFNAKRNEKSTPSYTDSNIKASESSVINIQQIRSVPAGLEVQIDRLQNENGERSRFTFLPLSSDKNLFIDIPQRGLDFTLQPIKTLIDPADPSNTLPALYVYGGYSRSNLHEQYTNTSSLLGSDLEMGVILPLGSGFTLSSGFALETQRFQTAFKESKEINIYKPETIDSILYYKNRTEIIYTDSIAGIGTRMYGYTNKVSNFSIPVDIGFTFHLGSVSIMPQIGVGVTVAQTAKMNTASETFEIAGRSSNNNFSFSPILRGGLSIQFAISERWSLSSRYLMRSQNLHSWQDQDHQRYFVHGGQLGIFYSL